MKENCREKDDKNQAIEGGEIGQHTRVMREGRWGRERARDGYLAIGNTKSEWYFKN